MSYPDYQLFKYRLPEINLSFTRNYGLLFSYYHIESVGNGPRQIATCKVCDKSLDIIAGSTVYSSYTFGLTFHLKTHPEEWVAYIGRLADSIIPDSRSKYEHFKQMNRTKKYSSEESTRRLRECIINSDINIKNCAGVVYRFGDSDILKNKVHNHVEDQNARIFKYLHRFTNQNLKGGGKFECTMRDYPRNHTNKWPKWMIPNTLVQFFAAVQMKIFSESSLAILKSKMAIFRPKMPILRPF